MADRDWADWSPVSGQQYGYVYDNIGNRQSANYGGDTHGENQQTIDYGVNNLNEYTNVATPGYQEVVGVAIATNSVTVNTLAPDRKVEYFHREISTTNGGGPVWQNVSVIAGTTTNSGGMIFPRSSQTLTYDTDGNLTFDGVWSYAWDGENRLISMTMTNIGNVANSNRLKLNFAYDCVNRRVSKTVSEWNGSSFTAQSTNFFVYDGWNVIAVINPAATVLDSFTWGLDLGGSMTKAGGVGGLLMFTTSSTNCFAGYDGNGGITVLASAIDKSTAARYEYSPFGQMFRVTGPLAHQNPLRFSTKFWDDESGVIYYGYRYYSPIQGRWIGRDPSGEHKWPHLYGFCSNRPLSVYDILGREEGDLGDVLTTMGINSGLGALSGGAINGVMGGIGHMVTGKGSWADVGKDVLTGMATGALMGPFGKAADSFVEMLGFGEGMVGTEFATGLSKGFQAGLSSIGDAEFNSMAWGNSKDIQKIMNDPTEQFGIGVGVGMVAGMMQSGIIGSGGWGDSKADSYILDVSTDAAGKLGVDAAESIWSTATGVSEGFGP